MENQDVTGTKSHRLLKLLGIYLLAMMIGVVLAILLPDTQVYAVVFYIIILCGVMILHFVWNSMIYFLPWIVSVMGTAIFK